MRAARIPRRVHTRRPLLTAAKFLRESGTSHIHYAPRTRRAHLFIEFKTYELLASAVRGARTALFMNKIHIEPIRAR